MAACATTPAPPPADPPASEVAPASSPSAARAPAPKAAAGPEASAAPEDEPSVEVLLDEGRFTYDRRGAMTAEYRLRYRILHASALDSGWATVSTSWAPWHEARPDVSATVEVGGRTLTLDPSTLEESGARGRDPTMFQDYKRLRGPLPGLAVGALVETRVVIRETRPFFEGGRRGRFYFGAGPKTEKARLVVQVPAGLKLRWRARGFEIQPAVEDTAQGRTYTFEGGPYDDDEKVESLLPPDIISSPRVEVSVAEGWAPIASAYAKLVDDSIARGGVALEAKSSKDRIATIAAVLQEVHRKVRYTGLELGVSSIEPATPRAVIERGYGDCKDKATIVVSALRARGIDAHVALLRSGYAFEVPADVPALDHFDHAIVYVPGTEPLWIDATVEALVVGDVPLGLQGRQALVARNGEKGLVRIPELTSDRNEYRELRAVTMAGFGGGHLVEKSWGLGTMDRRLRNQYKEAKRKALDKTLGEYVEQAYGAEKLVEVRRGGATSPRDPFTLEIEAQGLSKVYTGDDDAAALLSSSVLFDWLPRALRGHDPDKKPRKQALFIYEPYRAEIVYRVTPPPGFVLRKLPPAQSKSLGPAKLERWSRQDGAVVEVGFRFDSGPRRYTPEQVDAFARALAEVTVEEYLEFDHEGAKLLAQGRISDAVATHQRLVAEDPKSAVAHARYARTLLAAGFGFEARKVAKQGVALDPKSFMAQFTLGTALSSDRFARRFERGMDRDGALAAYRAAKAIDDTNRNARFNVALLLEHDEEARRYTKGADLAGAIAEYEAIEKDLDNKTLANGLRVAMLRAGRFDALAARAEQDAPSDKRNAQLIAAIAVSKGIEAAEARAQTLGADVKPPEVLQEASGLLVAVRRYRIATQLMRAASRGSGLDGQARLELISKMRPYEEKLSSLPPPVRTVCEFVIAQSTAQSAAAGVPFVSRALRRQERGALGEKAEQTLVEREWAGTQKTLHRMGSLGSHLAMDSLVTTTEHDVEGSDALGYRVVIRVPGPQKMASTYFLVKEGSKLRIRAGARDFPTLGAEAAARLARGDLEGARQWLDWARSGVADLLGEADPKRVPFLQLWRRSVPRDVAQARIAAGALMVNSKTTAKSGLALLDRNAKSVDESRKVSLQLAQAQGHLTLEDGTRAMPHALAFSKAAGDDDFSKRLVARAQVSAKDYDGAKKTLLDVLEDRPRDSIASMMLFRLYFDLMGDKKQGLELLDDFIDSGRAGSQAYNEYAWSVLFSDAPRDSALVRAERAAASSRYSNIAFVHTLASVYAEAGRPEKAMQAFMRILKSTPSGPEPHDWYVFGRVAEAYGLADTAKDAYRKAAPSGNGEARTSGILARQGLERLGAR